MGLPIIHDRFYHTKLCNTGTKGQRLVMLDFISNLPLSCWEVIHHQKWLFFLPVEDHFWPQISRCFNSLNAQPYCLSLHVLILKMLLAYWLPFSSRLVLIECWEKCLSLPEQLAYLPGATPFIPPCITWASREVMGCTQASDYTQKNAILCVSIFISPCSGSRKVLRP